MTWRRRCATPSACEAAGEGFAAALRPGDIVLLSGPLGAGKTTFVKGVARGLGVRERVTSPTFVMVREHRCANEWGISILHHADVYRVSDLGEVVDLALGELVEESAVALVEWGELASSVFGCDVLNVSFALEPDDARTLEVSGALAVQRSAQLAQWERS